VVLTGPPRVVLGRSVVELILPLRTCTLEELLGALARAEPRIARYLGGEDRLPAAPLRPLLQDQLLEPGSRIPDGSVVTLLYAMAGGSPCPGCPRLLFGHGKEGALQRGLDPVQLHLAHRRAETAQAVVIDHDPGVE